MSKCRLPATLLCRGGELEPARVCTHIAFIDLLRGRLSTRRASTQAAGYHPVLHNPIVSRRAIDGSLAELAHPGRQVRLYTFRVLLFLSGVALVVL